MSNNGQTAPENLQNAEQSSTADVGRITEEGELSFAELLEQHEREEPSYVRFTPGQRVKVRIVAITQDTVFVSAGTKVDGIVDREELEIDGNLPYEIGDLVELYVVSVSPQEVKLSKIVRGSGSLAVLEEAHAAGLPVEGRVTADIKGGFAVELMKRRAFCPGSQMDLFSGGKIDDYLGKTYPFLITHLSGHGKNIVVSRRALLELEQAERLEELLSSLSVGDVVEAKIVRLAPFGAFAELAPYVEGLIHLSELSWSRIAQADEAVSLGDLVRVKIVSVDRTEKTVRISLSVKQVTDDPWSAVEERIQAGDVLEGKVVRLAPFGAFVEAMPGIEGLVHISEFSYERRIMKPEEVLAVGDRVAVKVKEVDGEKKRLSLSLRDVAGNPWDTVASSYSVGQRLVGVLERRAPFGLFIALAPGVTGLLPNSQQGAERNRLAKLGPGDAVAVRITEMDVPNRKVTLAADAAEHNEEKVTEKEWRPHAPRSGNTGLGSLGQVLQAALKNKDKK